MRISRFCEARGWYEADNSIESKIFCFGDDGPSGDSSSTAASEDIGTKDVDKGPSKSAPSGGDNQQDRQAYSDRFGGVSTRNFNVDTNQGFVDTDQGRVYGSSADLSKGIAEGDITPSESQQAALDAAGGIATGMGIDPGNIAVGGDLFFGEEDLMANQDLLGSMGGSDVPEFDEPGGAVSMYGIPGVTPPGSYASTPVTAAARGPALGTTDYESEAYGTARTPSTTLGPAGASGIAAARDAFRARGLDITGNIDPLTGQPVPGSGTGVRDVSTTISSMDIDPFSDPIFADEEERAADLEDLKAKRNMTIAQIAGITPVEQITAQARGNVAPTGTVTISQPTTGYASTTDVGARTAAPGPTGIASIPGKDPRAPDYTLEEAQANLEAARREAYADKQFGFDTGLPGSIDVFGVKVPTGVGVVEGIADALFDPEAALANQIAERGIKSVDGASAEGSANYNPQGLEVVTSGGPLKEGGRTVAYDARGNVVYDSRGIGSQFGDLLTGNRPPENIQALYDRQRAIEEQQREMQGGDGGQAMTTPPVEEPIPVVPEEYQGRPVSGEYAYQPMGPISYAYTGLPSLAPQVLRPSFQARGSYAPLYPMRRA